MRQYQTFIFDSYSFSPEKGIIELHYTLDDDLEFTETIILPAAFQLPPEAPNLDAALFALHLIGGISYYKTCLPKAIKIRSGKLTKEQAAFWDSVYENGLGEFFFKNDIDFRDLIHFPAEATAPAAIVEKKSAGKKKRILVPIG